MDSPVYQKNNRIRFSMDKNTGLIFEVKKFPALYDTSDPDYYVLGERNKAWLQVASNFNEPVDQCHIRWKNLRKRYAKEKRKIHEVLLGHRKPWPLFPKMSFLTAALAKPRPLRQKKIKAYQAEAKKKIPFDGPDDDMLILDSNDEIVRTCKSVDLSEEDEYIYETLDDPDSVEVMENSTVPQSKPKAIRSGGAGSILTSRVKSGRIRKLTPKMQNSIIAKKLKQAQEIIQQASEVNDTSKNTQIKKEDIKARNIQKNQFSSTLHKPFTEGNHNENNTNTPYKTISTNNNNQDLASIPPSFVRVEPLNVDSQEKHTTSVQPSSPKKDNPESEPNSSESNRPFKVVKLTGRNPIIFSPEQLPDIQNFLKSKAVSNSEEQISPKPAIKVKSVENLNQNLPPDLDRNEIDESNNNLDIIHSVGLMRKSSSKSTGRKSCGGRQYSWNKSSKAKSIKRHDCRPFNHSIEKRQHDSQTSDYKIEETWNDIKQELPGDGSISPKLPVYENPRGYDDSAMQRQQVEPLIQGSMLHKVNEAKLELIAFQRRLLEEQHRRSLDYMKKEHDLKMTLLKAEIDLKRKQLNIML